MENKTDISKEKIIKCSVISRDPTDEERQKGVISVLTVYQISEEDAYPSEIYVSPSIVRIKVSESLKAEINIVGVCGGFYKDIDIKTKDCKISGDIENIRFEDTFIVIDPNCEIGSYKVNFTYKNKRGVFLHDYIYLQVSE